MNIDLLPFSAFVLESCGPAAPSRGDAQTLTLQLVPAPVHAFYEPMGGSASASPSLVACANVLRAAVVPVDGPVLTITF